MEYLLQIPNTLEGLYTFALVGVIASFILFLLFLGSVTEMA